ncbi:MAG: membrane protein of unknown function [Promethearchaeota archaeon]|jgi:hypothetical protein|nr:MAG: membrane protein of unknown function [Candidatus Lokiarchaeota archaeon]
MKYKKFGYEITTSYILLQVLDIATTIFVLSKGGIELNPIVNLFNFKIIMFLKILLASSFYLIIYYLSPIKEKRVTQFILGILIGLNMIYSCIVLNNTFQIFKIYLLGF